MTKKFLLSLSVILLFSLMFLTSCSSARIGEDPAEEARSIHDKVLTVDTHSDTPMRMVRGSWDIGIRHEPGERSSGLIDLPRMKEGGLDALFFAAFVGQGKLTPEARTAAYERADNMINAIHKMCEDYPEQVELALSPEDAYRIEKAGKRAAFIGMENGYPIGTDLSLVEKFHTSGVRYITLCHGGDNDICDSATDRRNPDDNGLSEFGKKVVEECNRLGIMVDLSHASDKTFYDVLEASQAPVFASHSSVRALCDYPRNLSDDMLAKLAEKKGVIQITLVSSFLKETKPNPERDKAMRELQEKYGPRNQIKDEETRDKMRQEYEEIFEMYPRVRASVADLVDHIDYVVKLIGVNYVGIGSDFDGGGSVEGCDDVSKMGAITEELVSRGYSEDDIRKIWGGNIMRVFGDVIETSQQLSKE